MLAELAHGCCRKLAFLALEWSFVGVKVFCKDIPCGKILSTPLTVPGAAGYFVDQPGCSALPWCCNMSSTVEHWKSHSWNGQLTGPVSGSMVGMCVNLRNSSFPTHAPVLDRYSKVFSGVWNG